MFRSLIVVLAVVSFAMAQDVQTKTGEEKFDAAIVQAQAKLVECIKNLSPEDQAKIQEAEQTIEQMKKFEKESPEEAAKLMIQEKIQSQEKIQTELEKLPAETQARVKKAIEEIKASKTQRAVEFKTMSSTKCN